jgi:hypothetical protein
VHLNRFSRVRITHLNFLTLHDHGDVLTGVLKNRLVRRTEGEAEVRRRPSKRAECGRLAVASSSAATAWRRICHCVLFPSSSTSAVRVFVTVESAGDILEYHLNIRGFVLQGEDRDGREDDSGGEGRRGSG